MPMEDLATAVREKHELQQQLDAANQRNEELEIALKESINRRDADVATLGAKERKWFDAKSMAELRAEAAERKLAEIEATRESTHIHLANMTADLRGLEQNAKHIDDPRSLRDLIRKFVDHAFVRVEAAMGYQRSLAQIEQPQEVMGTVPNTKGRDWVRERFVGEGSMQSTPSEREESDSDKRLALALSWIDRTMASIVRLGLKERIFDQSQVDQPQIMSAERGGNDERRQ